VQPLVRDALRVPNQQAQPRGRSGDAKRRLNDQGNRAADHQEPARITENRSISVTIKSPKT